MSTLSTIPVAFLTTALACLCPETAQSQDEPHIGRLEQLTEESVATEPSIEWGGAFDGMKSLLDPDLFTPASGGSENLTTESGSPDGNGGDPDPNDVPVDGGLTGLLLAGIAYGVRRHEKVFRRAQNP